MRKTVSFGNTPPPATADEWVNAGPKDPDTLDAATVSPPVKPEAMKRLTIDVTESQHKAIKTACAERGVKMADEIRDLLAKNFPEKPKS